MHVIRPLTDADRDAVAAQICKHWTLTKLAYIDKLIETRNLPGLVAADGSAVIASITWRIHDGGMHVMTLVSDHEGQGIGSALLKAAEDEAQKQRLAHVLLTIENSSVDEFGFYQRRGYVLHRIYPDVMAGLRKLKPAIPETLDGIPVRDQIDLIKPLF